MTLYVLLPIILLVYVLVGSGVSIFRLMPVLVDWVSFSMSERKKKIEKRRILIIFFLYAFLFILNKEVYHSFTWVLFVLTSIISICAIFCILKLDFKNFNSLYKNKAQVKPTTDNTLTHKKIERNINSVFSKPLYNLLKKYDYIFLDENCTYEEVKTTIINAEQKVFRFKNYHEAKCFYEKCLKHSKSQIKDYCIPFNLSYNTLNKAYKSHNLSEEFKCFEKELEKLKKTK